MYTSVRFNKLYTNIWRNIKCKAHFVLILDPPWKPFLNKNILIIIYYEVCRYIIKSISLYYFNWFNSRIKQLSFIVRYCIFRYVFTLCFSFSLYVCKREQLLLTSWCCVKLHYTRRQTREVVITMCHCSKEHPLKCCRTLPFNLGEFTSETCIVIRL